MPKDNLPDPQSEIEEILDATLKGKDLESLSANCRISQYQKELGKKVQELIDGGGGGGGLYEINWGDIKGSISNQTDLQNAISNAETKATFSNILGEVEDNVALKNITDEFSTKLNELENTIEELKELVAEKAEVKYYTTTIPANNWSINAPYFQTISMTGLKETDNPIVDIVLADTVDAEKKQLESWNCISKITTANNSLTLICLEEKPEVDITIQMKVVN